MSREIRFRIWDGVSILDVNEISFERQIVFCKFCDSSVFSFKDIELMQYTGINDENGNEVYESDIVDLKIEHNAGFDFSGISVEYITGEVKWDDRSVCYLVGSLPLTACENSIIIVVGNIYENPELLNHEEMI